ncbi:hypothetical protein GA565_13205 [Rouxiella sp. S1S-2]|uniref:hypothetical protein n=1 Tax=Rouxiella sp. S1S-2 TaxID=2653856 RepID=UPI001265A8E2|nr:hypothetical protein [Rouxiella sp. S1S-2]KAB7896860.1 hypothetical protein GA565_13205 [Rouxiella sp. S1S-2]
MPAPILPALNAQVITDPTALYACLNVYNQLTCFIETIRNSPAQLLSAGVPQKLQVLAQRGGELLNSYIEHMLGICFQREMNERSCALIIDVDKARQALMTAEVKQLLSVLYSPPPFIPPEITVDDFSQEITLFLASSGLSSIGIPADLNKQVFKQLKQLLTREGALKTATGEDSDRLLLQFLSSRREGCYITGQMITALFIPFIKEGDRLFSGLGTALYHLITCDPLRILFPVNAAPSNGERLKVTALPKPDNDIERQAAGAHPSHLPVIAFPGAQPYYGPHLENRLYRISHHSTALFYGPYLTIESPRCRSKPDANRTYLARDFAGTTVDGQLNPDRGLVFYQLNTGRSAVIIDAAKGDAVVYLEVPASSETKATSMREVSAAFRPTPVLKKSGPTTAIKAYKERVGGTAADWIREKLQHLDRTMSLFSAADAQRLPAKAAFSWQSRKEARSLNGSTAARSKTLIKNPNIEQLFPDDYTYDDITYCYKPLLGNGIKAFSVLNMVEKMLGDSCMPFLTSGQPDVDNNTRVIPQVIALFYSCANLDMSRQPLSWVVNGYVKYILYLLNIDNVFEQNRYVEIYTLLNTLSNIDESLAVKLRGYIKIDSGSDFIDARLSRVIGIISFPFHRAGGNVYRTHEMRGWKLMLGMLIEQYFPVGRRGKPMERANDFIYLLTDNSVKNANKQKFMKMLTYPPLCFIIELMSLDVLHERLINDKHQEIISLMYKFNAIELGRHDALAFSSQTVVEQIYALHHGNNTLSKSDSISIIRRSLITSVRITFNFIMENWFYQSSPKEIKLNIYNLFITCWLKGTSRSLRKGDLFQGGVLSFEFNNNRHFFYIDDSAECSYLGASEDIVKNEMLNNRNFFKGGNIQEVFFEKTGHRFNEIEGELSLLLNNIGSFNVGTDFSQAAEVFVDHIAFSTPRKNKLTGSTFTTRMQDWYSDISFASFIPLWGCYDGVSNQQFDTIEKIIICGVEAPTLSFVADKSGDLIKSIKNTLYLRPQDLFSDITDTTSSSGTLYLSPGRGLILSTEMPGEAAGVKVTGSASEMIARFHGSSVESFSTYQSSSESLFYYEKNGAKNIHMPKESLSSIRAIETSVSLNDISSSMYSLEGEVTVNNIVKYTIEDGLLAKEEDINMFLDMIHGRIKDRQKQSLHATIEILGEISNGLLANVPHLITRKTGIKAVAYSVILMAALEVFKASVLAVYNEEKHGGYQDTNIIDFKLRFFDKLKLQFEIKKNDTAKPVSIERNIELTSEQNQEFQRKGIVRVPEQERVNFSLLQKQSKIASNLNKIIMDSLLLGLPFPRGKLPSLSLALESGLTSLSVSDSYFRVLSMQADDFIDLLSYRQKINFALKESRVFCKETNSVSAGVLSTIRREELSLLDALIKYKRQGVQIVYPDSITLQTQVLLEAYRNANVSDYVKEYNRVHRWQFLRIVPQEYLNFTTDKLVHYLRMHKNVEPDAINITRIDFSPFILSVFPLREIDRHKQCNNFSHQQKPVFIFPQGLPADVSLMLHQIINASPEQLLGDRATHLDQHRMSGLGIESVKSMVTPYYTMPARLFYHSRIIRYGFLQSELERLRFNYWQNGRMQTFSLIEVLAGRLKGAHEGHPFMQSNRMLKDEITRYLGATAGELKAERRKIELYYALYRREEVYSLHPSEFINCIAQRYGVTQDINDEVIVEIIFLHRRQSKTLKEALADNTDNSIVAYPMGWPGEACNEMDVYRGIRYGNLTPQVG